MKLTSREEQDWNSLRLIQKAAAAKRPAATKMQPFSLVLCVPSFCCRRRHFATADVSSLSGIGTTARGEHAQEGPETYELLLFLL